MRVSLRSGMIATAALGLLAACESGGEGVARASNMTTESESTAGFEMSGVWAWSSAEAASTCRLVLTRRSAAGGRFRSVASRGVWWRSNRAGAVFLGRGRAWWACRDRGHGRADRVGADDGAIRLRIHDEPDGGSR